MNENPALLDFLDKSVLTLFRDAVRVVGGDPRQMAFFVRMLAQQERAAQRRRRWEQQGVHVPPFMIFSVTERCNLNCIGCYARAQHRPTEPELSPERLQTVLSEADDLGIAIALIAGGEPLTRPDLLPTLARFPHIMFALFTNGTLLDETAVALLKQQRHIMPIISIEGHARQTDERRGAGIAAATRDAMARLKAAGIAYGLSLTVTSQNLATITDRSFVSELNAGGARLFFFVEYVPVQPGTEALCLNDAQRAEMKASAAALRADLPGLFIVFPGDEEESGGCLAAGRGFVHIGPSGRVEPCPFAPVSDASIRDSSLREALGSSLLRAIRDNHDRLRETSSGCALWENREWLAALVGEVAGKR